ncbi:glycoside hydrolase family 64 [Trichoderma arundinaceum]|uniref:Glycoside hydrolase family 64 n=1 Tax=Trichoderma arundinaceum TaxID=490622 RepID=A0A395NXA3_TRIAR|nr:glycoside hydrolase family 64 [Trichoderma arundinaceum]
MHHLVFLSTLAGAASSLRLNYPDSSGRGFTIAQSGSIENVIVTKYNTLNGTHHKHGIKAKASNATKGHNLSLELVNNYYGGEINAYIQGLDSDGAIVFIADDGDLIYPSSNGSSTPVKIKEDIAIPLPPAGESLTLNISIPLSSGRVYFCDGNLQFFVIDTGDGDGLVQPSVSNLRDPSASLNWGFIELTYLSNGALYANISYVDFVGLILSMILSIADGSRPQITRGLKSDAVFQLCEGLWNQTTSDGYLWLGMCVVDGAGNPVRVLSPNYYQRVYAADFEDYWQGYVDRVWDYYSATPLVIDTQTPAGDIECQVFDDVMYCDDDNRGYAKPTASDIWGCNSGPFGLQEGDNHIHVAVIPRLCAAFVRSTLLIDGGDVQPSLNSSYHYRVSPTHHYSRIVHELQVDGRGYAFSYDDVNPDGHEDVSGLVSSGNPDTLTIYVGTPPTN